MTDRYFPWSLSVFSNTGHRPFPSSPKRTPTPPAALAGGACPPPPRRGMRAAGGRTGRSRAAPPAPAGHCNPPRECGRTTRTAVSRNWANPGGSRVGRWRRRLWWRRIAPAAAGLAWKGARPGRSASRSPPRRAEPPPPSPVYPPRRYPPPGGSRIRSAGASRGRSRPPTRPGSLRFPSFPVPLRALATPALGIALRFPWESACPPRSGRRSSRL